MRKRIHEFAAGHAALGTAVAATLSAAVTGAIVIAACGYSTGAMIAAALAGIAVAALSGFLLGAIVREQTAAWQTAAAQISDLAALCGVSDAPVGTAPDGARLESNITAIGRAYRSLQQEREQSQYALEHQIARQAEFYAQLSHELRSPLNAILGYASLAIEDAEAGNAAGLPDDLHKIRGAGQSLLALIDSLLRLAEDRSGRETVARAPFVLSGVLTQIVAEHSQTAPNTRLTLDSSAGGETLFGNRSKVMRAIAGVLDDAVRGLHAETIAITTALSGTHDASVDIVFEVRAGAAARTCASGVLTRHLAERLAATISGSLVCDRQGGNLCRYTLRLPLDIAAIGKPIAPRAIALHEVATLEPAGEGKSALVIDDDPATVDLMGRWLKRVGYDVRSATNAEDGLELARSMAPDIVLLDALMPGRTGYDILPVLSALPALHDTPILLVTVDDDRSRGLAAGASDYVRKPVTETRLREIIAVYEKDLEGEILIVEDEADAAEVLARTVRRLGFSARHAVDGAEGLAALDEHRPSAILLDLNMPNVNGFDFIETVVRSRKYAGIPLIVLSGQELSVAQHHRLLANGCRYYMKGEAAPREIAATLREMVA